MRLCYNLRVLGAFVMKKMRIPLIAAFCITVIGIIFGSFFDLSLSQAIASPDNGFGLLISTIGPTIGFGGLSLVSGGFFALGLHKENRKPFKILFFALSVAAFGAGIYFAGKEYFGVNGFYNAAPKAVGFLIAAVVLAGFEFLGYYLFKDTDNKYAWIVLLIASIVIFLILVGAITVLKQIFHRPRFRDVIAYEGIEFHSWWQPCTNYKDLMSQYGLESEEFKSYPSGHTGEASVLLTAITLLPVASKKMRKAQLPLFIVSFAFVCLVGFARILAAAHFLSDVSTGAAIAMVLCFIANEIIIRMKRLHIEEETKESQAE